LTIYILLKNCSSFEIPLEKRERGLSDGGPGEGSTEYARGPEKGAREQSEGGLARGPVSGCIQAPSGGPLFSPSVTPQVTVP